MLAHYQSALLNTADFSRGLGVNGKTVAGYLDLLVDLLLVRRLLPWHSNTGKSLVKSPKIYVRDSGLVHALLGLRDQEAILGHPVAGASWEGFVSETLITAAPAGTEPFFYRTSAGAEMTCCSTCQTGAFGRSRLNGACRPRSRRDFISPAQIFSQNGNLSSIPATKVFR